MAKQLFFSLEFLGGRETVEQLSRVEVELAQVAKQLQEAKKLGKEDVYKELRLKQEELRVSAASLRQELKRQIADFKAAQYPIDSLIGLENQYAKLRLEIRGMSKDVRESAEGLSKIKLAGNIKSEIDKTNLSFKDFKSNIGNYVSAIKLGFADLVTSGLASGGVQAFISTLGDQFGKGFKSVVDYSGSLAELSANSLQTGDTLKKLEDAASNLTVIKLSGGQEIKNTASDILTAFKLVGAVRPELLQNAEALKAVTEQAIILSTITSDTLETSVNNLNVVLGQFNLGASKSAEVVNLLAAGSKVGAADTSDVAKSLKEFGLTANSFNVSLAESVGLVETLAEKQLKGAEAGTQLRNILVKLSAPDNLPKDTREGFEKLGINLKIVSDASLPLEARLKELSKAQGQNGVLAKAFGTENLQAALILTENVGTYAKFTKEVQGTNTAQQQAAIISDSLKAKIKNLSAEFEEGRKVIVEFLLQGLIPIVSFLIAVVKGFVELPKFIRENKEEFILLGIAFASLNGEMILATANSIRLAAAEKVRTVWTSAVTAAQWLLNAAMTANPISLVIAGVALLTAGFTAAYKRSESFRASINGLGALAKEIFTIIKEAVASFVQGFDQVKDGDFKGAFKSFVSGVNKINPVGLLLTEGKRLGNAFNKGYNDTIAEGQKDIFKDDGSDSRSKNIPNSTQLKDIIKPLDLEADKKAKERQNLLEKQDELADKQLKRINDLRTKINELAAKQIDDVFEKQISDAHTKAASEIEKLNLQLDEVNDKIRKQGGKKTDADITEADLIKVETEAIKTALDIQIAEIKKKRNDAQEQHINQLKKLQDEVLKISSNNQTSSLNNRLISVQAGANNQKLTYDIQFELDQAALNDALSKGQTTLNQFNKAKTDLEKQYNKDVLDLNKTLRERQINIDQEFLEKRLQQLTIEKEVAVNNLEDSLRERNKKLADDLKTGNIDKPTYDNTLATLDKKNVEDKLALEIDFRVKEQSEIQKSKDLQLQANKSVADSNKAISEEKLKQIEKEREQRLLLKNAAIDTAKIVSDGIFDLNKTKADQEKEENLKRIDDELVAKLEKVKGNSTLETAVKKEAEAKKLDIEREAFEVSKKRQITQALINGALAIISSLANTTLAFPFSLIAPAAIGLTTGFQIANIKAQKFADGGFTGLAPFRWVQRDETGKKPVGVVHENEYVAPEEQLQRYPELFRFLDTDRAKSNKKFADGGFTSSPALIRNNIFDPSKTTVYFDDDQIQDLSRQVYEGSYQGALNGSKKGAEDGTFKANDTLNRTSERQQKFESNNQY